MPFVRMPIFRRLIHLDSRKHHIGQKLAPSMSDADPSSGMAAIIEAVRSGKGGLKPGMIDCVALEVERLNLVCMWWLCS